MKTTRSFAQDEIMNLTKSKSEAIGIQRLLKHQSNRDLKVRLDDTNHIHPIVSKQHKVLTKEKFKSTTNILDSRFYSDTKETTDQTISTLVQKEIMNKYKKSCQIR